MRNMTDIVITVRLKGDLAQWFTDRLNETHKTKTGLLESLLEEVRSLQATPPPAAETNSCAPQVGSVQTSTSLPAHRPEEIKPKLTEKTKDKIALAYQIERAKQQARLEGKWSEFMMKYDEREKREQQRIRLKMDEAKEKARLSNRSNGFRPLDGEDWQSFIKRMNNPTVPSLLYNGIG